MSWFLWYITTGIALVIGTLLFDWPELKRDLKSDPVITIGALQVPCNRLACDRYHRYRIILQR